MLSLQKLSQMSTQRTLYNTIMLFVLRLIHVFVRVLSVCVSLDEAFFQYGIMINLISQGLNAQSLLVLVSQMVARWYLMSG